MFRKKDILGWSKVCLTWLVAFLMAFDVCSAGVLRRLIRCQFVNTCPVRYVPACPVVTTCPPVYSTTYSTPTYSQPVYSQPMIYESAYQTTSYAAPTCHDCNVTACDGMCGDYSAACGGGGEIINECAGVSDFGYSDCCGNESHSYVNSHINSQINGGYNSGSVVNEGSYDSNYGGELTQHGVTGEIIHEGTVVDEGSYTDHAYSVDSNVVDDTYRYGDDVIQGEVIQGEVIQNGGSIELEPQDNVVDRLENQPNQGDYELETPTPADNLGAPGDFVEDDLAPMPNRNPTDRPVDDFEDDLFGNEPAENPALADPTPTEPMPVDPAPRVPDPLEDDLFGNSAESAADAMPTDDGGLDDLFDSPPDAAPPAAEDEFDDLFGNEAPADPQDEEGLEDLFDNSGSAEDEFNDLFSSRPERQETPHMISFISNRMPMRSWWDNTGKYRTVGSLLIIAEDHVRIIKSNGNTCTVPFYRLSDEDITYVKKKAEQHVKGLKVAAK